MVLISLLISFSDGLLQFVFIRLNLNFFEDAVFLLSQFDGVDILVDQL